MTDMPELPDAELMVDELHAAGLDAVMNDRRLADHGDHDSDRHAERASGKAGMSLDDEDTALVLLALRYTRDQATEEAAVSARRIVARCCTHVVSRLAPLIARFEQHVRDRENRDG